MKLLKIGDKVKDNDGATGVVVEIKDGWIKYKMQANVEKYKYYDHAGIQIYFGNALEVLKSMEAESAQCAITSPPYWGLRT